MYKLVNNEIQEMTEEEVLVLQKRSAKTKSKFYHTPLSQQEVTNMIIKQQINTLSVDDQTSYKMKSYYPTFNEIIGKTVDSGFKFTYLGKLYKTVTPDSLLIQEQYTPSVNTASLYVEIVEDHLGNEFDPIPYDGNMILELGKFYVQNEIVYECIESSLVSVYADLKDLPRYVKEYGIYEPLF